MGLSGVANAAVVYSSMAYSGHLVTPCSTVGESVVEDWYLEALKALGSANSLFVATVAMGGTGQDGPRVVLHMRQTEVEASLGVFAGKGGVGTEFDS